jgi:hypothetical protein
MSRRSAPAAPAETNGKKTNAPDALVQRIKNQKSQLENQLPNPSEPERKKIERKNAST